MGFVAVRAGLVEFARAPGRLLDMRRRCETLLARLPGSACLSRGDTYPLFQANFQAAPPLDPFPARLPRARYIPKLSLKSASNYTSSNLDLSPHAHRSTSIVFPNEWRASTSSCAGRVTPAEARMGATVAA